MNQEGSSFINQDQSSVPNLMATHKSEIEGVMAEAITFLTEVLSVEPVAGNLQIPEQVNFGTTNLCGTVEWVYALHGTRRHAFVRVT